MWRNHEHTSEPSEYKEPLGYKIWNGVFGRPKVQNNESTPQLKKRGLFQRKAPASQSENTSSFEWYNWQKDVRNIPFSVRAQLYTSLWQSNAFKGTIEQNQFLKSSLESRNQSDAQINNIRDTTQSSIRDLAESVDTRTDSVQKKTRRNVFQVIWDAFSSPEKTTNSQEVAGSDTEYINKYIPKKWHNVALDFSRRQPEVLKSGQPVALASARSWRWIFVHNGQIREFPIIIGSWGTQRGTFQSGTPKTPTDRVVQFNSVNIADREYWDASLTGSKTVQWASLIAPELAQAWGKWWHGVADYRLPGGKTAWCVGLPVPVAREMARVIQARWWYGFVSDGIAVS